MNNLKHLGVDKITEKNNTNYLDPINQGFPLIFSFFFFFLKEK